jgi:hypothetical protein
MLTKAGGVHRSLHHAAQDMQKKASMHLQDAMSQLPSGPSTAMAAAAAAKPSELLKTLRPPPVNRPLFLAAPGVANAQSAYFSFSSFLQVRATGTLLL